MKGWERAAAGEERNPIAAGAATGRKRPALFSDEVLARLPVRRVAKKG